MCTEHRTDVRKRPSFIEAARRAQILAAAIETIAELGFANASLARIAERAGITKGAIGYYFASRDELIRQAVTGFYQTGHESMMARLKTAGTATEMLRRYIASNLAYIDENRVATRAMGEIIANFRDADGKLVFQYADSQPMIEGTKALFEWGQATGEFRLFDARVMAVTLRAAVDGFAQELQAKPDLDVPRYAAQLTDIFLQAAANPEPPSVSLDANPTTRNKS